MAKRTKSRKAAKTIHAAPMALVKNAHMTNGAKPTSEVELRKSARRAIKRMKIRAEKLYALAAIP